MINHECVFVQSSPPPSVPYATHTHTYAQYQGQIIVSVFCACFHHQLCCERPPVQLEAQLESEKIIHFQGLCRLGEERSSFFSFPQTVNGCTELQFLTSASSPRPLYANLEAPWGEKCVTPSQICSFTLHLLETHLLNVPLSPILSPPVCSHLKQPPFSVTETKAPSFVCITEWNVIFSVCVSTCNLTHFPLFCCVQPSSPWPFLCAVLWDFTSLQEAV